MLDDLTLHILVSMQLAERDPINEEATTNGDLSTHNGTEPRTLLAVGVEEPLE